MDNKNQNKWKTIGTIGGGFLAITFVFGSIYWAVATKGSPQEVSPIPISKNKVEEPKADKPKADEPKTDQPKVDEPKTDEPKTDEPKTDEPKVDEPKVDEPKVDEPKAEESKAEESKAEEPKKEETKVETQPKNPSFLESQKAISWYYMKQGEGKIPRFPSETANFGSKAYWVGEGKSVYLTFDTGSDIGNPEQILSTLKNNNVKVTFFITGKNMKDHPDMIKKMVQEGHVVANHSMTHRDFTTLSTEEVKKEIEDAAYWYEKAVGQKIPPYFRFPYGKYSGKLLNVVSEMGYTSYFWSTAMRDWEPRKNGWKDTYHDIMNNLHDGNIILMHQNSKENVEALNAIIKEVKAKGYQFKTIDELQS